MYSTTYSHSSFQPHYDPEYEFHAPKFFDFTTVNPSDEVTSDTSSLNTSLWFEEQHELHEKENKRRYHSGKENMLAGSVSKHTNSAVKSSEKPQGLRARDPPAKPSEKKSVITTTDVTKILTEAIAKPFNIEAQQHVEEYQPGTLAKSLATKYKSNSYPDKPTESRMELESYSSQSKSKRRSIGNELMSYLMKETKSDRTSIFGPKSVLESNKESETRKELQLKYITEIDELVSSYNEIAKRYNEKRKNRSSKNVAVVEEQKQPVTEKESPVAVALDSESSPLNFSKLLGRELTSSRKRVSSSTFRKLNFNQIEL